MWRIVVLKKKTSIIIRRMEDDDISYDWFFDPLDSCCRAGLLSIFMNWVHGSPKTLAQLDAEAFNRIIDLNVEVRQNECDDLNKNDKYATRILTICNIDNLREIP